MATISLSQGQKYRATVTLGFLKAAASDAQVGDFFQTEGFSDVRVERVSRSVRLVTGIATQTITRDLPSEVSNVTPIY